MKPVNFIGMCLSDIVVEQQKNDGQEQSYSCYSL